MQHITLSKRNPCDESFLQVNVKVEVENLRIYEATSSTIAKVDKIIPYMNLGS